MDAISIRAAIEAWRAAHWYRIARGDARRWTPTLSPFMPDEWPPEGAGRLTAYLGGYRTEAGMIDGVVDIASWAAVHIDVRRSNEVSGELLTDRLIELGPRGVRPLDSYEGWLIDLEDSVEQGLAELVLGHSDDVQSPILREYYRMWVALNPRDALFMQPRHPTFFQWLGPGGTVERIASHYYALREWFFEKQHGTGELTGARQQLVLHIGEHVVPVTLQHFLIGRSPECDLVLPGNGISREHATIVFQQGAFWLNDLGSSFGTLRDGEPVRERVLIMDRTRLTIGAHEIRCELLLARG